MLMLSMNIQIINHRLLLPVGAQSPQEYRSNAGNLSCRRLMPFTRTRTAFHPLLTVEKYSDLPLQ